MFIFVVLNITVVPYVDKHAGCMYTHMYINIYMPPARLGVKPVKPPESDFYFKDFWHAFP